MGSILITQEGVETNSIEVDSRDKSFFNFYTMLEKALKLGDCCFMTEATYKHSYSYGDYYPAFVNLNWEDFQKIESLCQTETATQARPRRGWFYQNAGCFAPSP